MERLGCVFPSKDTPVTTQVLSFFFPLFFLLVCLLGCLVAWLLVLLVSIIVKKKGTNKKKAKERKQKKEKKVCTEKGKLPTNTGWCVLCVSEARHPAGPSGTNHRLSGREDVLLFSSSHSIHRSFHCFATDCIQG